MQSFQKESGPEPSFLCAGPYWQTACKPNFVVDDHSSRPRIAARAHQRPTRRFGASGRHAAVAEAATFPPIWSCSVWGLPCLRPYSRSGALLPHLFTLTLLLRAGRYIFCGTGRPRALTLQSRTLSGTLPCGVRTFLPRSYLAAPSAAIVWLACQYHRTPSKCARRNSCTSQRRERVPLIFPYAFSSNYICW